MVQIVESVRHRSGHGQILKNPGRKPVVENFVLPGKVQPLAVAGMRPVLGKKKAQVAGGPREAAHKFLFLGRVEERCFRLDLPVQEGMLIHPLDMGAFLKIDMVLVGQDGQIGKGGSQLIGNDGLVGGPLHLAGRPEKERGQGQQQDHRNNADQDEFVPNLHRKPLNA